MPMTGTRQLMRRTDFRWLWSGQTISVLGSQVAGLAFPVLAVSILKANEAQMGLLNAADTAAFLFFGLIAGAWVDRWRKRKVMIVADAVRLAATALIPLLWYLDVLNIYHLMAVGAVVGIATVFFDVAYQSYVPVLLPSEHIGPANSALETTNQIARIGGPSVVGVLLGIFKAPMLLVVDAISYALSAFSLMMIRDEEKPQPKEERQPLRKDIAEGVAFVWQQKMIRAIAMCTASTNLFSTICMTLLPLLLLRDLELTPAIYGTMMSVASVGGLIGAVSTTPLIKLLGEGPVIAASAVIGGLAFLLVPLAATLPREYAIVLVAAAEFISFFTILTYNITQVTARQRLCPKPLLGRMNASIRFFVWGVMPIGSLIGGWLGSTFGILPTMWIGAVGTLLSAGFVVFNPVSRLREVA